MKELLLFLVLTVGTSAQNLHYVKPSNFSAACPGESCLTLDEYAAQQRAFLSSGATFHFLPGNHSLHQKIDIQYLSDITLIGTDMDCCNIICFVPVAIFCRDVSNMTIERITFILSSIEQSYTATIMLVRCNRVTFSRLSFLGSGDPDKALVRALFCGYSNLIIHQSLFKGSTADTGGAILSLTESNITIIRCSFINNTATAQGGAIYVHNSHIILSDSDSSDSSNTSFVGMSQLCQNSETHLQNNITTFNSNSTSYFENNVARGVGGAIYLENSQASLTEGTVKFVSNSATRGGAIYAEQSSVVSNCRLYFTDNWAQLGGAINMQGSDFSLSGIALFFSNQADLQGGAINMINTCAIFRGNHIEFATNYAEEGGAIAATRSTVISMTLQMYFAGNRAEATGGAYAGIQGVLQLGRTREHIHTFTNNSAGTEGGAIFGRHFSATNFQAGTINLTSGFLLSGKAYFINNHAIYGGALLLVNSSAMFNGTEIKFVNNTAETAGGAISCNMSTLVAKAKETFSFIGNSAPTGGAIFSQNGTGFKITSAHFVNNTAAGIGAVCGGAMYFYLHKGLYHSLTLTGNTGTAVCFIKSNSTFSGNTVIRNNSGGFGGGLSLESSSLFLIGHSIFANNKALNGIGSGGAIRGLYDTVISITGSSTFMHNSALHGGAIHASDTHVSMDGEVQFMYNTAENGGAMYFRSGASVAMNPTTALTSSFNFASKFGGAIYHEDSATLAQCKFEHQGSLTELPHCFLKLNGLALTSTPYSITSYNDSAGLDGSFLYGGLIDKCVVYATSNTQGIQRVMLYSLIVGANNRTDPILRIDENGTSAKQITSKTYKLCFCVSNEDFNCSEVKNIEIHRGQTFIASILATAQTDVVVSTTVMAKSTRNGRLQLNQTTQVLPEKCTSLNYNLYSSAENEELILYADGPCRDTGLARAVINVKLRPCPAAFTQSGEVCVCEERLLAYVVDCIIEEDVYIVIKGDSKFWMGASFMNDSYHGLILYETCPREYCSRNETLTFHFEDLDAQCSQYRSGVLCGECATNYSLMLGSSKCEACSNTYLALVILFAAMGVILVIFLSVLRLTVATGMLNSIILYANIVQANKMLFFPLSPTNILTVFIAWMNLDFGFSVCFYHGMDAYTQTWLQLVFPIYVWFLIISIIVASRYSTTLSALIGHNPIAVLATLLLMTYTKILKIAIEVYSSVDLDYPDDIRRVWLKDASVPYLQSRHLLLTVVITLILVLFFLPYTLILLLGYKFYRFSGRKYFRWFNKILPLLDSYYAPYKLHARYWTGLLLLIRCVLYIVFALYSLRHTEKSLVAIIVTFTSVGILFGYCRIYKSNYVNILEISVYINLIILSVTVTHVESPEILVSSLVGVVFVTMMAIIVYHFHLTYISKSSTWLGIKERVSSFKMQRKANSGIVELAHTTRDDPHKIVTKGVIDLREPLLEN